MKIYQVHYITEAQIVSCDSDIPDQFTEKQILKFYNYVIANSHTDAKLKACPHVNHKDECYALEVSKETVKSEIIHCKELIAYWNTQPDDIKQKEQSNIIIARQINLIKHYNDILNECAGI